MRGAKLEKLIVEHMGLVTLIAKHALKSLPNCVDPGELESIGYLALVQKARTYNPRRHPRFAYYAKKRIFGAMIDAYRGRNYPRMFESIDEAWMQGGTAPGDYRLDGSHPRKGPYSHSALKSPATPDQLIDPGPDPQSQVIEHQSQVALVECISDARRKLTPAEGRAIDRHLEGYTMREVGQLNGRGKNRKSGAWACYTVNRAKAKLRAHLESELLKAA